MIDARLVWDTWRRILTDDALVNAVLAPPEDFASLGLGPEETAIVADYASTRAATDQTIFMYRNGLPRNALSAIRLVPLSSRLLSASGLDIEEVAREFTVWNEYRDDGPHLWRLAGAFVAYLATLPELAEPAKQDVLALDAAAIALVRRLGETPPASWPDHASPLPDHDHAHRYAASRAATVASSSFDLTPWLENPYAFDSGAGLDAVETHWLVYVPDAGAAHTYAELSARAARAFTLLATPRTVAELAAELDLSAEETLDVIESLAELGVVSIA